MISLAGFTHHPLIPYLLLFIPLYATYALVKRMIFTYRIRTSRHYAAIPTLPRHPIMGNLINMGALLSPALNRHPDYGFEIIWQQLSRPPGFLMDLAPVDKAFLVVADPTLAELVVQPSKAFKYSTPKSDTLLALYQLVGMESLIMAENDTWKNLRRRFNRGFSPAHLHSLGPLIISKTRVFIDRLTALAESGEVFAMQDYAQDLTTDIITELTIETDFRAQSTPEGQGHKSALGILTASRLLSGLVYKIGQGIDLLGYIDPIRPTKSWFYEQVFNRKLYGVIKKQLDAEEVSAGDEREKDGTTGPAKAIAKLALSGMTPTPALIRNTVDQIKSFLFAGQDTTATLIQWIVYELSKPQHTAILSKLRSEHDSVFGTSSPFSALEALSAPTAAENNLGDKLPYTTAFVKETLRLHPPAGTARLVPHLFATNPTPFTLPVGVGGEEVQINGLRIYVCQWLIHRNPAVWGTDAHVFRPDRWLDEAYVAALPAGAWRPFERGPRNCIGQELAMMEGKIVLAAVARGLAFEKVGLSGTEGEREVWNINRVTSVPVDGMRMRVKVQ